MLEDIEAHWEIIAAEAMRRATGIKNARNQY